MAEIVPHRRTTAAQEDSRRGGQGKRPSVERGQGARSVGDGDVSPSSHGIRFFGRLLSAVSQMSRAMQYRASYIPPCYIYIYGPSGFFPTKLLEFSRCLLPFEIRGMDQWAHWFSRPLQLVLRLPSTYVQPWRYPR